MIKSVSADSFREVMGRFVTGVTVISAAVDGSTFGTTASAVSSLSLEPPMLLVCLNRTSETRAAIARSGAFVVNVLGEEQEALARAFAVKSPTKFKDVPVEAGTRGVPLLAEALAHIECSVAETATGGTHTVFIAQVERVKATEGRPLTYFRGRFGRLHDLPASTPRH